MQPGNKWVLTIVQLWTYLNVDTRQSLQSAWTASPALGALISPNYSTNIKSAIRPKVQLWCNSNPKCRCFLQPIIIKALLLLTELGQPLSCLKTASGKQHYRWRHENAAGWRGKFHFKLKESSCSHSQKPHWASTLDAEAGFRLRMKTQSLSYHGKHFKNHLQKVWLEIGTAAWSVVPRGKFVQLSGYFPWLIWLQQKVPGREQGNQTPASHGFGHALCLGGFYLVWLVDFYLRFVLVSWKKIRDGAGSYPGRGTEGSPGHTCSSYGDKRIFFEVGLLIWVLLETTLPAEYCSFVRLPLLRIPDYLWLSEFLSHKVDFLPTSKRTPGSLSLHYPVYERKQEYKMRTINHPEKYHNPFQMFCQANKPNTGILQEKKKPFCYRATHFITRKLDSLLSLLHA